MNNLFVIHVGLWYCSGFATKKQQKKYKIMWMKCLPLWCYLPVRVGLYCRPIHTNQMVLAGVELPYMSLTLIPRLSIYTHGGLWKWHGMTSSWLIWFRCLLCVVSVPCENDTALRIPGLSILYSMCPVKLTRYDVILVDLVPLFIMCRVGTKMADKHTWLITWLSYCLMTRQCVWKQNYFFE